MDQAGATSTITLASSGPSLDVYWDTDLSPASANEMGGNPYVSEYTVTLTGTDGGEFAISCPVTLIIDTPCDSITFSDLDQTDLSDTYTGTTQYFVLSEFTIAPAICEPTVTYSPTSVVGPDIAINFSSLYSQFKRKLGPDCHRP